MFDFTMSNIAVFNVVYSLFSIHPAMNGEITKALAASFVRSFNFAPFYENASQKRRAGILPVCADGRQPMGLNIPRVGIAQNAGFRLAVTIKPGLARKKFYGPETESQIGRSLSIAKRSSWGKCWGNPVMAKNYLNNNISL